MNERIIDFISSQKVATVCCTDEDNNPYCFSCFFAFDVTQHALYFKTSAGTRHADLMLLKSAVAGTVQPDKLNPMAIKGLQFTGQVIPEGSWKEHAAAVYHRKYPFALAMKGDIWMVKLEYIKMTDNTLAFGKKIIWESEALKTANAVASEN